PFGPVDGAGYSSYADGSKAFLWFSVGRGAMTTSLIGPTGRRRVASIAGAAVVALLASCSFGGTDSTSKNHDSLTMEYQNFPILDPQRVTWGMWLAASGLYEGLVELTPDGRSVTPGTAERWDISADRRTYTFHLRASQWSDG